MQVGEIMNELKNACNNAPVDLTKTDKCELKTPSYADCIAAEHWIILDAGTLSLPYRDIDSVKICI